VWVNAANRAVTFQSALVQVQGSGSVYEVSYGLGYQYRLAIPHCLFLYALWLLADGEQGHLLGVLLEVLLGVLLGVSLVGYL